MMIFEKGPGFASGLADLKESLHAKALTAGSCCCCFRLYGPGPHRHECGSNR